MMILNDPVPHTLDMAKIKPPLIFLSKNLVSFSVKLSFFFLLFLSFLFSFSQYICHALGSQPQPIHIKNNKKRKKIRLCFVYTPTTNGLPVD